ncbi:MAG: S8 family serine peptidase, partial [Bacteroidia bacterium]|nr:S8 family serine peptidase [Bacteroidia bacterium]NNM15913.1 S8 family serine peptidase [Bacteroidia bacterium]
MKLKLYSLLSILIAMVFSLSLHAQTNYTLLLKNGNIHLSANSAEYIEQFNIENENTYNGNFYKIVQFSAIPSTEEQQTMQDLGFHLLEYIPHNAWIVSIDAAINISRLNDFNIRAIADVDNSYKLQPLLLSKEFPEHALRGSNTIELVAVRHADTETDRVVHQLNLLGEEIIEFYPESRNLRLVTPIKNIQALSDLPFITYLEVVAPPAVPEDTRGRSLHRSSAINTSPFYGAGRKYDGAGVKVAVNDDGFVGPHIDYTGRIDNSEVASDFTGTHGDGVAGIVGAAGNLDPSNAGMATGVFQKIRQYSSSMPNTVNLHTTQQIMMFNSSYSNGTNAGYTSTTQLVDNEIYNNTSLMQVFSAGNSNGGGSTPAGSQWFNITGGHKAGKNVIATANLYYDDVLVSSSSRGPAHDGRIKPDIASNGQNQISTSPDNAYSPFGGTSGAAPGIMGCAAQLYHAYKDLNGGANPPSGLIKAALMNTSYDLGNAGPDFKYGWGRVDALRALRLIEDNRYFSSTISNGGANAHNIAVPANCKQMRVMVYWVDPAGAVGTNKALVNDINIILDSPNQVNYLPLILNPTPNATTLDLPAVPGMDTLNNVEQVRIENPVAGTYTLNVAGAAIPTGPQTYWVVYEFILDEIEVTYPIGGESFARGETEALRWDAHGTTGSFTLEYSTNNG